MRIAQKTDPIELFNEWFAEAEKSEPGDPTTVALATANSGATPSVRVVLLKNVDARGFTFFTNLESRKAEELKENPQAAMCFYWEVAKMQVRVEGRVEPVSAEEADAYFASRPRNNQIGAWASDQSRPLGGMFELEKRFAMFMAKFAIGPVPRPPYWSGYRLIPLRIEFWRRRAFRLHERIVYDRDGDSWKIARLYP